MEEFVNTYDPESSGERGLWKDIHSKVSTPTDSYEISYGTYLGKYKRFTRRETFAFSLRCLENAKIYQLQVEVPGNQLF